MVLELVSAAVLLLSGRGNPYAAERRTAVVAELADAGAEMSGGEEDEPILALHPYLGFVYNPDRETFDMGRPVSPFGFHTDDPIRWSGESDDELRIAIVGGSMAAHMALRGREAIESALADCQALGEREVAVISLALGGYKQPQQLATVAYFLSLGARFDVVVNLDGVNELVWYVRHARRNGIDPSYPYNWYWMTLQAFDPASHADMERIASARKWRRRLARSLDVAGAHRWASGQLVWRALSGSIDRRESAAELRLQRREQVGAGPRRFQQTGAVYERFDSDEEALAGGAALWRRGSALTRDLVEAQGIPYLHLLQPNQHFPGTKPLTGHEREAFAGEASMYHGPLSAGYEHLLREGERLTAAGVDFVDLSRIFDDHPEELYVDDCCHVNVEGNRILGAAVGRLICERLDAPAPGRPAAVR